MTIGPGLDPETDLAPLANKEQFKKITEYVEVGKEEGATVLYEGSISDNLEDGYYVLPVLFGEVTLEVRIWNNEVFGPVMSVATFDTVEEAIDLANNSQYGLSAAI